VETFPDNSIVENTYEKIHKTNETILCYGYEKDLIQVYDFYCARYENISYKDFLDLGISEIQRKIMSIPESEPLYTIIKSRIINIAKIKDKSERKHWRELKEANKIPDIYKPSQELDINLNKKLGGINGKRFM
jgi:hypothetical protein